MYQYDGAEVEVESVISRLDRVANEAAAQTHAYQQDGAEVEVESVAHEHGREDGSYCQLPSSCNHKAVLIHRRIRSACRITMVQY